MTPVLPETSFEQSFRKVNDFTNEFIVSNGSDIANFGNQLIKFLIERQACCGCLASPVIPVAGVAEITFDSMQVSVNPGTFP